MKDFNLSRWALDHRSFVVYLMLVIALAGIMNYRKLGREEDPPFTIKTMVVKTLWPGATTLETIQQVTDRVEKKLEELPNLDYLNFALTSDGFPHRELRDHAERLRGELLSVPDVAKIDLIGTQEEKIYLEFSTQQLAAMRLDISTLITTLQAQNAIQPSGTVDAEAEKIAIRVSGQFTSEESLNTINFRANGRFFRLSDIAK